MANDDPTMDVRTLAGEQSEEDQREIDFLLAKHKISRDTVEGLRATEKRLYVLRDLPVIFRGMRDGQFDRIMNARQQDRTIELKNFASYLIVYPDAIGYQRLLADYPMVYDTIIEAAVSFAKGKRNDDAKKL